MWRHLFSVVLIVVFLVVGCCGSTLEESSWYFVNNMDQ